MTELNQTLNDIRKIRRQVAETTQFRGYGPLTLFATAAIAGLAGLVQRLLLPDAAVRAGLYVAIWMTTALVCAALIATQMLTRASRLHSGMADEMIRAAVAQFLPAGIAGAALPFVMLQVPATAFWMLPGLWQVLFALGVFASSRSLPRTMSVVGGWFLLTGFGCIALGDNRALQPAMMAGPFAVGMAAVAAIHSFSEHGAAIHEDEAN